MTEKCERSLEICRETSQSDVVPILGFTPSPTTVLGKSWLYLWLWYLTIGAKLVLALYYKFYYFFQLSTEYETSLNIK